MTTDRHGPAMPGDRPARLWRGVIEAFESLDRPSLAASHQILAIFLTIVLISVPFAWTGNEENYFLLAYRSVAPAQFGPWSAVFDHTHDRLFGFWLLGHLIGLLGYGPAHLVVSLIAPLLLAGALYRLGQWLDLAAADTIVAVALFCLCGQTLMGGEWIFGGVETKTFAYGFGLLAFVDAGYGRLRGSILWCALAIYMHFLVGAFWVGATCLLLCVGDRGWRSAIAVGGAVVLLSLPLLVLILTGQRYALAMPPPTNMPSADYIYSVIRAPHHVAPFAPMHGWLRELVVGLGYAGLIGAAALCIAGLSRGRLRALAIVVASLPLYLVLATVLSWFDRHTGLLGKLYLFRPACPLLLLATFLGVAAWRPLTVHATMGRMFAAAVIVAIFSVQAVMHKYSRREGPPAAALREMIGAVRARTAPSDPVLLDPATDGRAATTREIGRPTIVNWKFVPTSPADIYRWWTLIQRRRAVFAGDCTALGPAVRYVVATTADRPTVDRCGVTIWSNTGYALIRLR